MLHDELVFQPFIGAWRVNENLAALTVAVIHNDTGFRGGESEICHSEVSLYHYCVPSSVGRGLANSSNNGKLVSVEDEADRKAPRVGDRGIDTHRGRIGIYGVWHCRLTPTVAHGIIHGGTPYSAIWRLWPRQARSCVVSQELLATLPARALRRVELPTGMSQLFKFFSLYLTKKFLAVS